MKKNKFTYGGIYSTPSSYYSGKNKNVHYLTYQQVIKKMSKFKLCTTVNKYMRYMIKSDNVNLSKRERHWCSNLH